MNGDPTVADMQCKRLTLLTGADEQHRQHTGRNGMMASVGWLATVFYKERSGPSFKGEDQVGRPVGATAWRSSTFTRILCHAYMRLGAQVLFQCKDRDTRHGTG